MPRLGVMIDRDLPPEALVATARAVEDAGADDVWVVEDLGWGGGVAAASTVLAVTERVRVGIGIMPTPLRSPVLAAMELATLARLHPGRLVPGFGNGVQEWMADAGVRAASPLALLGETLTAVRGLLDGERVTMDGRALHLRDVGLVHPPAVPVPLLAGVTGPRSTALAGRLADGIILVEGSGPAELAAARNAADRDPFELVVLTHLAVGDDVGATVRGVLDGFFGGERDDAVIAAGRPDEAAAVIRMLWASGADTVVVRPVGDPVPQIGALLGAL